jgi:hypothetical protein
VIASIRCRDEGKISITKKDLRNFFAGAERCISVARKRQLFSGRKTASSFNVFTLIEPDENKLSDIIADLLDPQGRHGQGVGCRAGSGSPGAPSLSIGIPVFTCSNQGGINCITWLCKWANTVVTSFSVYSDQPIIFPDRAHGVSS